MDCFFAIQKRVIFPRGATPPPPASSASPASHARGTPETPCRRHLAASGSGCGTVRPIVRSLRSYPRLVAEYHPALNVPLEPGDVSYGSIQGIWWRCSLGHEWLDTPNHRTRGRKCPYCSGRRVCPTNSLASLHPELIAEWHPTKNGKLTPWNVTAGSERLAWWRCPRGTDHVWRTPVWNRTRPDGGRGCPCCAGRTVSKTNSLAALYPKVAREWHPTRNRPLTPETTVAGSCKKVWWRCAKAGHEWQATVETRARAGHGCHVCTVQVVTPATSLASRVPSAVRFWHAKKNAPLTPWQVAPHTGRKVWWRCPKGPDHEWEALVQTQSRNGGRCPYCSHRKLSVTNCLATRFPAVARQWHPTRNGTVTPRDILAAVSRRYWWRCAVGHEWQALVANRTSKRSGCPICGREKAWRTRRRRQGMPLR